jgi:hypothetical protein
MRKLALAVAALLLAVSCGGKQPVFLDEQAGQESPAAFELPDPVPASPAWVASLSRPASNARLQKASKTPGVAVLAPVSVKRVLVIAPGGRQRLRVASVDPLPFRSVAPASTRDAEFVWTALMSDRAVMTFDAAHRLAVKGSEELTIGKSSVRVGAFADNGIPNLADVLVSQRVARRMSLGGPRLLVIGAKTGVTIETLGRDLQKRLPGARLKRIRPDTQPSQEAPESTGSVSGATIGTMQFRILKNGFIDPDPAWVASNITTASVPILGSVRCHRILLPQLSSALAEIADAGLADRIRVGDYGGCYVPRFIDRDPRRGLSMHAFGLAIDLNVSTNQLGTRGDMDPDIVRIFQEWGFAWGGFWARPDPMHFELARIVQ